MNSMETIRLIGGMSWKFADLQCRSAGRRCMNHEGTPLSAPDDGMLLITISETGG
jgi:hypothetical protein